MTPVNERAVRIPVADGLTLSGALHLPASPRGALLVCHPHPAFGGTMESHVVVAICQAAADAGLATLRFDFRGVGGSDGEASGGEKEPADVLAALAWLEQETGLPPHLAGYSFGAAMALAAATLGGNARSICCVGFPSSLSALTAERMDALNQVMQGGTPIHFIGGDSDSFCDMEWLRKNLAGPNVTHHTLPGEDHYFRDGAEDVAAHVITFVTRHLPETRD